MAKHYKAERNFFDRAFGRPERHEHIINEQGVFGEYTVGQGYGDTPEEAKQNAKRKAYGKRR